MFCLDCNIQNLKCKERMKSGVSFPLVCRFINVDHLLMP